MDQHSKGVSVGASRLARPNFRLTSLLAALLFLATPMGMAQNLKTPSSTSTKGTTTKPVVSPALVGGGGGGTTGVTTYFEQGILSRSGETIAALGPNLMGDAVNEYSGGLEFTHTDVSLPGNNALPVAVGRHLAAGTRQAASATGLFGDWDLDIPHLHTVTTQVGTWYGNGWSTPNLNRCTQFQTPPGASVVAGSQTISVSAYQYWDGYHLYIPGSGDQTMLGRFATPGNPAVPPNQIQPTDGLTYPVVTKQNWQFSCLSSLQMGSGEGFVAHAPDGSVYQFDHMVSRTYPSFKAGVGAYLLRAEVWILPTQVTDRFGNWVRYTYSGDGWQVSSITSSDGRTINFTYSGNGNRIQSISDGTRTWSYAYDSAGALQTVTLPDSSQWQFSLSQIERDPTSSPDPDCDATGVIWDTNTRTGTITHPSGATGTFNLLMTQHGRSNVPGATDTTCVSALASRYFSTYSLISKTLSGPGMPAMTWSYAYSTAIGSYAPCSGCAATKTVTITDPLGKVILNTYGTRWGVDDGLLLSSAEAVTAGGSLRSTSYSYMPSNAGPWPTLIGYSGGYTDSMSVIHTPQNQRTITQQGVNFTQTVTGFDSYARATGVTRASTLGYSRAETTSYHDNTNLWVLGQEAGQTVAGVQAVSTSFNPSTALPSTTYKFGKLQASYAFNADGTLYSITDGASHTTTFSSYMRGLPQHIGYADGSAMNGVVNNIGVLTSVTNEAGTTWNYGYDAMGRLASKTPPGGDAVAYNATTLSFVQVPSPEYGLEANHWRQTITTGNAVTVNYFDARWRKRLTTTYDAANVGGTQRMQVFNYDPYNRTTYASYPARSISSITAATTGTATVYDPLGRPSQILADSELGTLTTNLQYLGGFQKQVTNPRGYTTTTAYQVFDEPSESALVSVAAPEGLIVSIARDALGKPQAITRSGSYGGTGVSATRSYFYDGNQLLCKTVEPETGATIQALDGANNVAWRAIGLGLTNTASCDTASVPAANKISYSYDPRNRLTGTSFGDASPAIGRSYTPDGLPATVSSNGSTWTYSYNNRRLPTQESLVLSGQTFNIGWAYDANGHTSQLTYPDLTAVAYGPNALGEATQVSGYASGVSYHPNGAVAGYTLANGIAHSLTQNTRGLPLTNSDAGVMQDQYGFDANGNIAAITDQQEGVSSRSMGYDGLDRLAVANAPGVWGSASYSYDPLDNIRSSTVGSRNSTHNYDGTNRLSTINSNGAYTGFFYDSQGNITARGSQGFYFDQGNRMVLANGVASYSYDGLGRRTGINDANGLRIQVYSQGGQLLYGTQQGVTVSNTRYIYLGGKLIAEDGSNGKVFSHTDALGSPVARTNASGALLSRTRYEAYGKTAAGTDPATVGFTGHVNDPGTGLVYMQQRYYDPIAARFMSIDPITTDADTGSAFNRYQYANSNPYRYTDPDGRYSDGPPGEPGSPRDPGRCRVDPRCDRDKPVSDSGGSGSGDYEGPKGPHAGLAGFRPYAETMGAVLQSALETYANIMVFFAGGEIGAAAKGVTAAKEAAALGREIGIVREANLIKGNVTLSGEVTRAEMDAIGKTWVGPGYRATSDGSGLVSADALRVYRAPALKPNSPYATTGVQANLEQKLAPGTRPFSNAHINVTP